MLVQNYRDLSLDYATEHDHSNFHHQMAIIHYTKAIKGMRQDAASGKHDLRTMIISCLVIACFEGYH